MNQNSPIAAITLFGGHVIGGTIVFLIVLTPAIGMSALLSWMNAIQVDQIILATLNGVKLVVFFTDVALYLLFIIVTAYEAAREIVKWTR